MMLREAVPMRGDEIVLIHSAAGAVGSVVIQVAGALGARKVIGTAGTAARWAHVRELGADVAINYSEPDWPEQVNATTNGPAITLTLDAIGGREGARSLMCMAPHARFVAFGMLSGNFLEISSEQWMRLFVMNQSIIGFGAASWLSDPAKACCALDEIFALAAEHSFKLRTTAFPLDNAAGMEKPAGELDTGVSRRCSSGFILVARVSPCLERRRALRHSR
jgi:NADPH2:quinone reductase